MNINTHKNAHTSSNKWVPRFVSLYVDAWRVCQRGLEEGKRSCTSGPPASLRCRRSATVEGNLNLLRLDWIESASVWVCVCMVCSGCMCIYVCVYICVFVGVCVCACVCICVYVCVYVCMCVCVWVCVYMFIYVGVCVCVCV